ncbi:hypothetical protein J8I87_12250 [Paraburkholderia sp. LEh10]|uniref:hypothetical protein n=1 Tax=Paraburkholderia sp. LEh10 TaxID=2821353 RepID=UPI001AE5D67E|nr:hypothetical protein [Paraburkholderia sp. LEh10]MBP0590474.1 hypothetical protein [Paraburkholderia sp. LEh10]
MEAQVRRRTVTVAFCVIWLVGTLCLFGWFGSHAPTNVPSSLAGLESAPSIVVLTFFLYVIGTWTRDRSSFRAFWRLMRRSQGLHKATFDFLKNAAVPIAAVATVGKGLNFMVSGSLEMLPPSISVFLPPGANVILWIVTLVMYPACAALVIGALLQANLAIRQAADDYVKDRFKHFYKGSKISPVTLRYFRRNTGVHTYLSILLFVTLLAFASAFLYALYGK